MDDPKQIRLRMDDFHQRWNIQESDRNKEVQRFRARLVNALDDIDKYLRNSGVVRFCQIVGIEYEPEVLNVYSAFIEEKAEVELYFRLEALFMLPNTDFVDARARNHFLQRVSEAVEFSRLDVRIICSEKSVLFVPSGDTFLDSEVVDTTMNLLDDSSRPHFLEALLAYKEKNAKSSIKSAESLRRCVEEFLRFKLANRSRLKENITQLLKALKSGARDAQLRNIISTCLGFLDQYFNENSKHADGDIDEAENEYLIYQVGTLLRYIDRALPTRK